MINIQIFINIFYSALIYLIVAVSFSLIYYCAKFFNLALGAIIAIAAYFVFLFSIQLSLPLIVSIPSAILLATMVGLLTEKLIFKPLRNKNSHSFVLLIASLGLYVILQNIISLVWGDNTKSFRSREVNIGHEMWGAYITDIQIITIVIGIVLFLGMMLLLSKTKLGKQIRAISSNDDLSNIFGVNSNRIIFWIFAIGSVLAAIAGILVAFDTDMTPTMGFNLLLYGIVAMIIGGVGSIWGLVWGSLLLATAQHLGAYYIDSKWMDAIAYVILILFLIWKPLGFSGRQLKKIEI